MPSYGMRVLELKKLDVSQQNIFVKKSLNTFALKETRKINQSDLKWLYASSYKIPTPGNK